MNYAASFEGITTCDLSDACDAVGVAAVSTGQIRGVYQPCRPMAGPVVPIALAPHASGPVVVGTLQAIVAAPAGSVMLLTCDGRLDVNTWGSLAGRTAVRYGMAGVVIDGATRDVQTLQEIDLPTYARGTVVTSVRGRVGLESLNEPVSVDGQQVDPGWIAAADVNGVLLFPHERAAEIFAAAHEVARLEDRLVQAISQGADPIEAHKAFRYDASIGEQLDGGR